MAKTIIYTSNKTLVQSGNTFTINSGMNIGTTNVITSGKWYWEVKIDTLAPAIYIGVTNSDFSYNIANADQSLYSLVLHCGNRNFKYKNTTITSDLTNLISGDVIGIFVEADSKIVHFYKNGVKFKEIQTDFKDFFPFVGYGTTSGTGVTTFNFGANNFFYVPKNIDYTVLAYETEKRFIFLNKFLILSGTEIISIEKSVDSVRLISLPSRTEQNYIKYGMDKQTELDLSTEITKKEIINKDGTSNTITIEPTPLRELLGNNISILEYTDSPSQETSSITLETEPFSVYDYIGELPSIIAYTESTEDVIVSTNTEPFDIYDEFGDTVDVLYYTDNETVTNADLILEANWSPIDELEGDFDIVTWTDEEGDSVARKIEMQATPKPQFIKLVDKKRIYGYLKDIIIPESSKGKKYVRFFLSPDDTTYYVWDKLNQQFKTTSFSNETDILNLGMTSSDLDSITEIQWNKWQHEFVNICIFLKDNARDTTISSIDNMSYNSLAPTNTNNISSLSLYILNTTAKINVELQGNLLKGTLSDDDLTRVQYRVILNNKNFYPKDGNFTALSPSPQNINLEIPTKEMIIGGINTLKVEFQDFFGTTDYWLHQFIGEYSGVMFADEQNKYYSTDTGEILRSLDFGTIIAGQTSQVKIIYIQNKHSFDIHNIMLSKLSNSLPDGVELQISKTNQPFVPEESLMFEDLLHYNDKLAFYARLKTIKNTEPGFGEFDIGVKADPIK
ncbi:gp366 [Bacillus phage G]|uniref:Gp366 n=1 Tax=Bacillus phage G TaxID=2884420 RepID=G3MAA7_9CAUD|nr:gp366 [Bacillus phage G]AEO93625.1 gp366 [Bacillus phage G]